MEEFRKVEQALNKMSMASKLNSMAARKKMKKAMSNIETEFRHDYHKLAYQLLRNPWFDALFSVLIMANLVIVIIETDTIARKEVTAVWTDVLSWLILIGFVFELALRLYVNQHDFFLDGVNIFDFVLVALDAIMNLLGLVLGNLFPVSFLRIVRLFKLARVGKAFHKFPELRLMVAGLLGSMKAIFWGTVLLAFTLLTFAIVAVQFIHPMNEELEQTSVYDGCERCPRAYASVADATLTFCQTLVAGDSWGMTSISLIEHYPESVLFFGAVFMVVGMAVLNLILGVVVDVASQARDKMRNEIADEQLLEKLEAHNHLLELCKTLDKDGNGEIDRKELDEGYANSEGFRDALAYMDVGLEDLEVLWTILDADRSGTISYAEFVTSCYKMKSSNTHFMLAYIKYYITIIKDKILKEIDSVKEDLIKEEKKIEEELLKEEAKIESGIHNLENGEEQVLDALRNSAISPKTAAIETICKCGNVFLDDATFCRKCGKARPGVCSCGNIMAVDALFCRKCGKSNADLSKDEDEETEDPSRLFPSAEGIKTGADASKVVLDIKDAIAKLSSELKAFARGGLKQESKHEEKSSGKDMFEELLFTSNQQQLELMATMRELQQQLGVCSGDPPKMSTGTFPVPQERSSGNWLAPPQCCAPSSRIKVEQLTSP